MYLQHTAQASCGFGEELVVLARGSGIQVKLWVGELIPYPFHNHLPMGPPKPWGIPVRVSCRNGAATAQPAGHSPLHGGWQQQQQRRWQQQKQQQEQQGGQQEQGGGAGAAAATKGAAAAAAATATKEAAAAAAAIATRAEAARATTPQTDSTKTSKEKGDRDSPGTGPWRSIKTRQPTRLSKRTGLQTCKRSGGWLVEVASQQALLFLISSEAILCLDLALACS